MDKNARLSGKGKAPRDAVLEAFSDHIQESGYSDLRVVDLVQRSGVARSTFYEHFGGRDDVLRDSMRRVLQPLADLANGRGNDAMVRKVLEHFVEQRELALQVFEEHPTMVLDLLAELVGGPPLTARTTAGAQFAVLAAWLQQRLPGTAADVLANLREVSAALRR